MASPGKLLQVQSVYGSPTKLHVLGPIASPPRKRRPSERKPGTSAGLGPLPGKNGSLSPNQWRQWMHEAQELSVSSSVFLATTSIESVAQEANSGLQLILNPVVARQDEQLVLLLETRANDAADATGTVLTAKYSAAANQEQQWRARVTKPRKRKKSGRLRVEPLLSDEMRTKLQAHLEEKIKGDIWENEIRSRLARPLSASTFCSRDEQLRDPLSAAQFVHTNPFDTQGIDPEVPTSSGTPDISNPARLSATPKFPYSVEAHASANCIRRCRLKALFRVALKARARALAVAIRVLRRRGVPLLVRGFRRRRRAAICIQRRYRRFIRWRVEVLRPLAGKNVAGWVRRALALAGARVLVARSITALYLARKARRAKARRRAAHLRRWAAKTRVSLFVHQRWTVCWFRNKRSSNVDAMKHELSVLEASDHNVRLEYSAILATPLGQDMVKKELAVWRAGARTRVAQGGLRSTKDEADSSDAEVDPAIRRLRQCFQIFDLDGSGTLDLDEFQLMLSYLRGKTQSRPSGGSVGGKRAASQPPKLTTAQVRTLFAELDRDGDSGITCGEFESWWAAEHERSTLSTSASTNFLSRGLDGLLLQSHGLLFRLLGRKLQLERKFVKKLMVRRAMATTKRDFLHGEIDRERAAGVFSGVFRCRGCGRRFGLRRDVVDHVAHECNSAELVVDTFTLKRWVHEEEFRLIDDVRE
ncbi:hypothetical protein PHYPSEUDO_013140 [Phytophthora pseudosyringae]|uniref:EF-hand domain-containing protein n=1 Tax=Phytophthora pseudosyringae TaxID=221518 RepID=A0A8T1V6J5_9STRA|nr:hypothetical protein PHYPSEUDO_013140 [Phytophthora pseudosyringae]